MDKKRRYFIETIAMAPMYCGTDAEGILTFMRAELENLEDLTENDSLEFIITYLMLTDEEVEALPDV